jgi:hypothetical protein
MLLAAANNAGGHSTVDTLAAIAILIWIVAGAVALLGWAGRRLQRWQPTWRLHNQPWSLVRWLRTRATHRRIMDPAVAPAGAPDPSTGSAGEIPDRPPARTSPASPPAAGSALQQAAEAHTTATLGPPAIPGARHSPETLELLGQHLDNSRRLAVVEDWVAPILGSLPRDRWLVERYVLVSTHRIPFLIIGETGVFALWATGGPVQWREVPFFGQTADRVKLTLPGYTGQVQAGVCRALTPDLEPRWWCRAGEAGAWVMGLNWVIPWLAHFGPEHGVGVKDVERLREMAGPRWERAVSDRGISPLIPGIDQARLG